MIIYWHLAQFVKKRSSVMIFQVVKLNRVDVLNHVNDLSRAIDDHEMMDSFHLSDKNNTELN